ncbi:hypothetical protein G6F68_012157 [Rhizopus microsporus]|nr:hypothetical protein G6F68_012157 [Rhizopus microsporus]
MVAALPSKERRMSDSTDTPVPSGYPQAVLFDLLTALLDSWTVWNRAAGSEAQGRAWRADYLRRTYGCGAYQPYEQLVQEAAAAVGLPASAPQALEAHWVELPVWDGARELLQALRPQSAGRGLGRGGDVRRGGFLQA